MAEQGVVLDIDTQFLQRLEKADKALGNLVTSVDKVSRRFDDMASGSLKNFANAMDAIVSSIGKASNVEVGDMGISKVSKEASNAVDAVNELVEGFDKIYVGDKSYSNSALTKVNEEVDELMAKLGDVQSLLEYYKSGEGAKAIGFVDLTQPINDANTLLAKLTELEERRRSIVGGSSIAIERDNSYRSAQASLDSLYQPLFDEAENKLLERYKVENELAKKRNETARQNFDEERKLAEDNKKFYEGLINAQYEKEQQIGLKRNQIVKENAANAKQAYSDQIKAYEQMFDKIDARDAAQSNKQNDEKIKQEAQAEKESYELWLMRKHTEAKEHKRLEDEKLQATLDAINKQNEAYAKQKAYDEQNRLAKVGGNEARENYERQIHEYEKMYDAIDKSRRKNERDEEASIARENEANKTKAQSVIDNYIKETNAARDSYEKRRKMYEDLFKQQEEQERRTLSGAMRFSQGAGSISDRQQAIKYLSEARDSLNESQFYSAKEYKKAVGDINKEINRQKTYVDELRDKHKSLINTADQLKRVFTLAFSVSSIRGYVNRLIEVRGEFELQQRSLEALLQNKEESNRLWEQTVQLAVRSPYEVKQLVTYTKQLAAYRVETEKLHDTTKMLADISSGLGVEMGRLILAFGQVKAANYLRGTELRQFSEAGINILKELADYYGKIEGRVVSVSEVFSRVSARMVSFADVEKVLQNATSAGGQFYRMQEIQAETLKGQVRNLKDSIDLMMNDIGKSSEGVLKAGVSSMRFLISNYESLASALKIAASAFIVYKANALAASISMSRVRYSVASLNASLTAFSLNPWVVALSAIVGIGAKIWSQSKAIRDISKQYSEAVKPVKELSAEMNTAWSGKSVEGMRTAMSQLKKIAEDKFKITLSIDENASIDAMKSSFEEVRDKIFATNAFAEEFAKSMAKNQMSEYWLGYGNTQEKDIEQFGKTANDTFNSLILNSGKFVYALDEIKESLSSEELSALEELRKPIGDRTQLEYLKKMTDAYSVLKDRLKDTEEWSGKTNRQIRRFKSRLTEVEDEFAPFLKSLKKMLDGLDDSEKERRLKIAIDEYALEKQWGDIERGLLYDITNKVFPVNLSLSYGKPDDQELDDWAKRVKPAVEDLNKKILEANPNATKSMLFPVPTERQSKEQYEALAKDVINIATATYAEGQKIIEQTQVDRTALLDDYADEYKAILNIQDTSTRNEANENRILRNRVALIKEIREEYKGLRERMGAGEATSQVASSYRVPFASAFSGTGISFDQFFTSDEGTIGKLSQLSDMAKREGAEAEIYLQRAIGDIDVKLRLVDYENEDEAFARSIEEMFSGYELTLELGELDIPSDYAQRYFGLKATSLGDIKSRLATEKSKSEIGTKRYDDIVNFEKKVTEMEAKEQQSRLKTYLSYARGAMGERAKIVFEGLKKIREIEKTFQPSEGDSEATRESKREDMGLAIEEAQRQMRESLQKLEWEQFSKSDTFLSLFGDLESATQVSLDYLIAKLESFKEQWTDLPLDQMKELVKLLNDAKNAIPEDATFGEVWSRMMDARRTMADSQFGSPEEAEMALLKSQELIDSYNKILSVIELINRLRKEGRSDEEIMSRVSLEYGESYGHFAKMGTDSLKARRDVTKKLVEQEGKIVDAAEEYNEANRDNNATSADIVERLRGTLGVVKSLQDAYGTINEALGGGEDYIVDSAFAMAELIIQTIIFGLESKTAMGVFGWIMMAVEAIARILSNIFKAHDKGLEKQIERISERVEVLQEQFEKLEEAMDRAFSLDQVSRYSEEAKKNMESQIQGYQQMIALEEDKKKTDHEKIKEWEEAMEEVQEQYDELMEEGFNLVTSDILSDVMGAARDFVDAWHDAFMETGDGLAGLEQNFTDMFKELMRQQAAMSIVGPYVERFKDQLKQFVDVEGGDTTLTTEEAREWAEKVKNTFPEISALLQSFFEGTQDLMQEQGELSELSKGIQGVTESTAQVLEALLNSMRFYVADSNMRLQNIEAAFASEEVSRNPILNELRQQTQMIRSIESMFDSVIGRGGSVHAGAYLKVSM